ncbi:sugar ABC transporter permease [Vallitalea sediminicola]
MNKSSMKKGVWNLLFLLPALLLFSFIVVLPFLNGIKYSFTNWDGFSPTYKFIGISNYIKVLKDPTILKPISNSLVYTIITLIGNNVIGLLIAICLKKNSAVNKTFRTMIFMPFIISLVLTGFIWSYLYSDVLNTYFGIKNLLGSTKTVMLGISIMGMWRDIGYAMLIYLAALHGVPDVYYEAAVIDGAGAFKRFWNVTLPMIFPAITVNVVLFLGWGLKIFDYAMAATKGGPGRASETFAMYVYNYTFPYNRAGYGQAAAVLMMLGIFLITSIVTVILRKREVEL